MMSIPELGVGMIYFSGFEQVLESHADEVDVIEIEPQTFWYKDRAGTDSFTFEEEQLEYLDSFDQPKLFHGVGFPVGGRMQDEQHIPFLRQMMERLRPAWLSEHLSFNTVKLEGAECNTNFLLPPLQTEEGVRQAADNIKRYSTHFDLPFAFETGVNYLAPKPFEMEDGAFIDAVARASDAYILLDLHNLLANHRNGRQDIYELIGQIDPQRVLQIHLAGGFVSDGYYLDAHSGISDEEVMEVFEYTVRRLPQLKAVTFECLPGYLPYLEEAGIRKQFERIHRIWDQRGASPRAQAPRSNPSSRPQSGEAPSVEEWEQAVGLLAIGRAPGTEHAWLDALREDKGLDVIRGLVEQFKASMIVSSLRLTARYLMLSRGTDGMNRLLRAFWSEAPPRLFASDNGLAFAEYLMEHPGRTEDDPLLEDIVRYDYHALQTRLDGKEREVTLGSDPRELLQCLSRRELPDALPGGRYIVTISPDEAPEREEVRTVYHT